MSADHRIEGPVQRDRAGAYVALPFDPEPLWGKRELYRVGGTANGMKWRGLIERGDGEWRVRLTPMWIRDAGLTGAEAVVF